MSLAGLDGLRDRLSGGVGPAIRDARPPGYDEEEDELQRGMWERDAFSQKIKVRGDTWTDKKARALIGALAGQLRERRALLNAVLFAPEAVLAWRERAASGETALIDCWTEMFYIAEAAWQATVPEELAATQGYVASDAEYLRPAAARFLFLVLCEPMRWRGEEAAMWVEDQSYAGQEALDRVLGKESRHLLVARCREARAVWRGYLDTYQSYPLLSQARPGELEQELRTLVLRSARRLSEPLTLSVGALPKRSFRPLQEHPVSLPRQRAVGKPPAEDPLTADDKTLIGDAFERHFLPRFELLTVARLAMYDHRPGWRTARRAAGGLAAVAALTALGSAIALQDHLAVIAGVVFYVLICLGMLIFPAEWGTMWLLRMPAAAAVGMVLLTGFLPAGWLRTPPGGWLAVVVLAGVSYGYLLIEVRNHGVSPAAATGRALLVAVVGAMHALMVGLIGLVVVAPAFVLDGRSLRALWAHPSYGHAGMVLALAAAWCLTVGVFSQILWDDRPITAPLAHLSWRS
jgi:hypothetical protein